MELKAKSTLFWTVTGYDKRLISIFAIIHSAITTKVATVVKEGNSKSARHKIIKQKTSYVVSILIKRYLLLVVYDLKS